MFKLFLWPSNTQSGGYLSMFPSIIDFTNWFWLKVGYPIPSHDAHTHAHTLVTWFISIFPIFSLRTGEQNALCSKIWDVVPFCKHPRRTGWPSCRESSIRFSSSKEPWQSVLHNVGPPKIAKLAYNSKNYGSVHYTYNLLYNYCYRGL